MDLPLVPVGAGRLQEGLMTDAACDSAGPEPATGRTVPGAQPAILRTILGSCVGVTFWSARLGAGAMCHGVLPRCPLNSAARLRASRTGHRYVDFSIRYLAAQFDALGARRDELEVKLFGGADVLPVFEVQTFDGPRWAP